MSELPNCSTAEIAGESECDLMSASESRTEVSYSTNTCVQHYLSRAAITERTLSTMHGTTATADSQCANLNLTENGMES